NEEVHLLLVDLLVGQQFLAQCLNLGVVDPPVREDHRHRQFFPICHNMTLLLLKPRRTQDHRERPARGTVFLRIASESEEAYQRATRFHGKNVGKCEMSSPDQLGAVGPGSRGGGFIVIVPPAPCTSSAS